MHPLHATWCFTNAVHKGKEQVERPRQARIAVHALITLEHRVCTMRKRAVGHHVLRLQRKQRKWLVLMPIPTHTVARRHRFLFPCAHLPRAVPAHGVGGACVADLLLKETMVDIAIA